MRAPLLGQATDGPSGQLGGLLDLLHHQKEKQYRHEAYQRVSRRGIMVAVPLLFLLAFFWLRSGASANAAARAMHCYFLLDRTASMAALNQSVITGYDEFVQQQRAQAGSMYLSVATFNSENPFELRYGGQDLRTVPPLERIEARGTSPLYDALHAQIQHASHAEQQQSEREVVVVVVSGGLENASKKHSRDEVRPR